MDNEVLAYLNGREGAEEAVAVSTYRVYINSRDVTVEVYDQGEGTGSLRFHAAAYLTDLPEAERNVTTLGYSLGNPDSTAKGALDNIHWWEFDNISD